MKYQVRYSIFLLVFIFLGKNAVAQDCPLPTSYMQLVGNHLEASINVSGSLFWNTDGEQNFGFPPQGNFFQEFSPISINGLWLGAKNNDGQLFIAAATYSSSTRKDYATGPIQNDNGQLSFSCDNYDRLWQVFGFEIVAHLADFEDNGIIDNPISNIYAYPAQGNPFFENMHGFALPDTPQGLAPFFDKNNDGIYNPENGDFPLPSAVDENKIPSQIIWGVFNDGGTIHTNSQGSHLNAEIQLTAWSFYCEEDNFLNRTIFTSQKIINRSNQDLDSLVIGIYSDFSNLCMGNENDAVGSIPSLNTFYGYNLDSLDGIPFCITEDIPATATTFLSHDMTSFMYYDRYSVANNPAIEGPTLPNEFYHYLNARWRDGKPLTFGDNGYTGTQPVSFAFPDNPNDTSGWSMNTIIAPPHVDKRTIGNTYIGSFATGASVQLDMAYTLHVNADSNHLEIVNEVYNKTPILQQFYDDNFQSVCSDIFSTTENLKFNQIQIFPNPTSDFLNIKLENPKPTQIIIFNSFGKKVLEKTEVAKSELQLSTAALASGVYFITIQIRGEQFVQKFLKM